MSRFIAKIAAVAGCAVMTTVAASAADIPAKARPAPAAALPGVADWSGFYLGGHVGWGSALSRGTYDDSSDHDPIDLTAQGFLYGAQAGYNWQYGRLVYGVEVDGTWGTLDKSRVDFEGDNEQIKTNLLASARVRSGAAIDNIWLYGTIGVGYVRSKFTVTGGDSPSRASRDINGFGLVSGFGAEMVLSPNWSLRGEYLYYTVNKRNGLQDLTSDSEDTDFAKLDGVHVVRVGANYRFGGGAPVRAAASSAMNWSGFYLGAHAGWGFSRIPGAYDEAGDSGDLDIDPRGFVGGIQAGYNLQNGAWVYGIEADGSWSGMKNDRTDREGDTEKLKTPALASVRGRIGIAAENRLYYVTAGWGLIQSKLSVNEDGIPASRSFSSNAFVFGSGVDWAFTPNWSARLEGLTYLASKRSNLTDLTGDSDLQDFVRQDLVAVVRGGINYRFGAP